MAPLSEDTGRRDLAGAVARYVGEGEGDAAGAAVAGAGDVDGDGYADVLVGAPYRDAGDESKQAIGAAYLVLGERMPTSRGLVTAEARFDGVIDNEQLGTSVSGAGDVDGDGRDDSLVGAPGNGDGGLCAGAAWLVTRTGSVQFVGAVEIEYAGYDVAGAGDVNADGFDDVLVSGHHNEDAAEYAGAAYLVLGAPVVDGGSLADAGVGYTGVGERSFAGAALAGVGDVDADGHDDLVIGAPGSGSDEPSAAYLVLGSHTPTSASLAFADASWTGIDAGDLAGISVAGAGDVDADGYDDILVGAHTADDHDDDAGTAYLVRGSPQPAGHSLAEADARYMGEPGDLYGVDLAGAGDVDADGYADVLVAWHGRPYLVRGGPEPASRQLGGRDRLYVGEAEAASAGVAVSGAGDVDGDGYPDMLVGSWDDAGAVWLYLGGPSLP